LSARRTTQEPNYKKIGTTRGRYSILEFSTKCEVDRDMLPRDGSWRCVGGNSLLVPEDHPDARSRMMLT
jgi:hypothetical protein